MADVIPGTMVRMRVTRRYAHYNAGELIAVPFFEGRELEAKRLAQPLDLLIPPSRETPSPAGPEGATTPPARQPAQLVRK